MNIFDEVLALRELKVQKTNCQSFDFPVGLVDSLVVPAEDIMLKYTRHTWVSLGA